MSLFDLVKPKTVRKTDVKPKVNITLLLEYRANVVSQLQIVRLRKVHYFDNAIKYNNTQLADFFIKYAEYEKQLTVELINVDKQLLAINSELRPFYESNGKTEKRCNLPFVINDITIKNTDNTIKSDTFHAWLLGVLSKNPHYKYLERTQTNVSGIQYWFLNTENNVKVVLKRHELTKIEG